MRTLTRVYDAYQQGRRAVEDLERAGIAASKISIVANKHADATYDTADEGTSATAVGTGLGATLLGGAGLLAGLGLLAIPGLGPVVAAGWLASTVLGIAAGAATGGLVGVFVDLGMSSDDAHVYAETVRRGGTLVSVQAADAEVSKVEEILDRLAPVDVTARRSEYSKAGWREFDSKAPAYRPSNTEIEQIRREDTI